MKILTSGDKHLKITRLEKSKAFLEWFNLVILNEKPDLVVALGDDMDTHAVLRSEIMSEFKKHIDFVMKLNIPMVYLVGNHDYYKPGSTDYHSMEAFKNSHSNFYIVDKPTTIFGMDFIPYISDIKDFPITKNEICFAHQTFIGADYGYHRPDVGVNADLLLSKKVISGHIHKRQSFGKVIYPGSPYAHNLNDIDQEKGVMLFDTDTYETRFISSPFPRWRSITFDIKQDTDIDALISLLKNTLNNVDTWVLILSGPKAKVISLIQSKEYLELTKDKSVTFKPTFTDSLKKNIIIKSMSIFSIVDEYIEKVFTGSIDKDKIRSKVAEILKEN